jgi:hypothetical protein
MLFVRWSGPAVEDADEHLVALDVNDDLDGCALGRVPDGIVEQVPYHVAEQGLVRLVRRSIVGAQIPDPQVRVPLQLMLHGRRDQPSHGDRLAQWPEIPSLRPEQGEEVFDDPVQTFGLLSHVGCKRASSRIGKVPCREDLGTAVDRGDRRAEFMG